MYKSNTRLDYGRLNTIGENIYGENILPRNSIGMVYVNRIIRKLTSVIKHYRS